MPKIHVDWYAKGGIMTKPTAFGISKDAIMAGGEDGDEAIAPVDVLQKYIAEAVTIQNYELNKILGNIYELLSELLPQMQNKNIVLNSGVLVGELSYQMDDSLGRIRDFKGRGM